MSATILFPRDPHWLVGSHIFWPIVDRIHAALPEPCRLLVEPLFEPSEVFQFISLDEDVSAEAFRCFAWAARSEFDRCLQSEREARLPHGYYQGIMDHWSELVLLLESDRRWCPKAAPG